MEPEDAVFIDTSGWIALLNRSDYLRSQATQTAKRIKLQRRRLVTSDWVVAEVGNGLARTRLRRKCADYIQLFITLPAPMASMIRVDDAIREKALALYRRVDDKDWGLVDCASFTIMRELGIADALTEDRHFAQAGFTCLLATEP